MADESIIVKEQGTIFLGGPPLVSCDLSLKTFCFQEDEKNHSDTVALIVHGHFQKGNQAGHVTLEMDQTDHLRINNKANVARVQFPDPASDVG